MRGAFAVNGELLSSRIRVLRILLSNVDVAKRTAFIGMILRSVVSLPIVRVDEHAAFIEPGRWEIIGGETAEMEDQSRACITMTGQ